MIFSRSHTMAFPLDCGAGTEFSCDGEVNISIANAGVFCSDITCTSAGEDHSFEGCSNAEGDLLITVDGETFVVSSGISTDGTCTKVTMTITDSTGTHSNNDLRRCKFRRWLYNLGWCWNCRKLHDQLSKKIKQMWRSRKIERPAITRDYCLPWSRVLALLFEESPGNCCPMCPKNSPLNI